MKTIEAVEFKEQCLTILGKLTPEGLIITKQGKPVARLLPYAHESKALIGSLRDKIEIRGDIMSTRASWSSPASRAAKGPSRAS